MKSIQRKYHHATIIVKNMREDKILYRGDENFKTKEMAQRWFDSHEPHFKALNILKNNGFNIFKNVEEKTINYYVEDDDEEVKDEA